METESGKFGFDLNNIRVALLLSYRDLCDDLNSSIQDNQNIIIDPKKIKSNMDQIRMCIGIIAAAHVEGREDFKAVGGEVELPLLNIPNE